MIEERKKLFERLKNKRLEPFSIEWDVVRIMQVRVKWHDFEVGRGSGGIFDRIRPALRIKALLDQVRWDLDVD